MRTIISIILLCAIVSAHYTGNSDETLRLSAKEEPVPIQKNIPLLINIQNATTGSSLKDFDISHDRIMHVFIVDPALARLTHTHPEDYPYDKPDDNGSYTIEHTFQYPGTHAVAVDYVRNKQGALRLALMDTQGEARSTPNLTLTRKGRFLGYDVTISGPETIDLDTNTDFVYHIEHNGKNVTSLQQHVGNEMHVFMIDAEMRNAGHSHAYIPGMEDHFMTMPQTYVGPDVPVRLRFPDIGKWVVFSEFKVNGTVVQTRFVVNVSGGSPIDPSWVESQNKPDMRVHLIILVMLIAAIVIVYTLRKRAK